MGTCLFRGRYLVTGLYATIFWCKYVKYITLLKENDLSLTKCARYLWEMELNVCVDVSSGNTQDCEGIRKETRKVNSTNAYVTTDDLNFQQVLHQYYFKLCYYTLRIVV
jgi:hypothetical protein